MWQCSKKIRIVVSYFLDFSKPEEGISFSSQDKNNLQMDMRIDSIVKISGFFFNVRSHLTIGAQHTVNPQHQRNYYVTNISNPRHRVTTSLSKEDKLMCPAE